MAKVIICDVCGKVIGPNSPDGLFEVFYQEIRIVDNAGTLPEQEFIKQDLCRSDAEKAGWPKKVV